MPLVEFDFQTRTAIAEKQQAVREALADLLSSLSLTEAHEFVVTELSRLGGAIAI